MLSIAGLGGLVELTLINKHLISRGVQLNYEFMMLYLTFLLCDLDFWTSYYKNIFESTQETTYRKFAF
jgi:hypothetical protein